MTRPDGHRHPMPLTPGSRLGHFEVGKRLGQGGMGTVFRARDTQLGRDVALKVLPDAFSQDPDRLARFEREAQVLASLNHPGIGAIYGVEHDEPVRALVLELIEGPTLEDRIALGPVPVDEAVRIAAQIAGALAVAHDAGIIHRDLKPANVKVREDGTVKVLDFGLAKATEPAAQSDPSVSPTMTSAATQMGLILGTAAYMAPEQARGRVVDRRADVWALGVVLYEMLTGRRAFGGEDISSTLADVIRGDVDWDALPDGLPPVLTTFLERCLKKDPDQRLRDVGDLRFALLGAFDGAASDATPTADDSSTGRVWRPAAAAVLAAVLAAGATWVVRTPPAPPTDAVVRFDASTPSSALPFMQLSPDGRHLAFLATEGSRDPNLWVYSLETGQSERRADLGVVVGVPFWSPDSRRIGYADPGVGLRAVPVAGGVAQTLSERASSGGASWGRDGVVVFSWQESIQQVSEAGGAPSELTRLDLDRGEGIHVVPSFLPDGRHFLYARVAGTEEDGSGVYVGSIDRGPGEQDLTPVLTGTVQAMFVSPPGLEQGFLVFAREGALYAQPFDDTGLELTGEPTRIADGLASVDGLYGFTVSQSGVLAYQRDGGGAVVVRVGRDGSEVGVVGEPTGSEVQHPRVSPEGDRLAVVRGDNVWVYDLGGRPPVRVTYDDEGYNSPLWMPGGDRLVVERNGQLHGVAADGSGTGTEPVAPPDHFHPQGWLPDGSLVATQLSTDDVDLVAFPLDPTAVPRPLVSNPAVAEGFAASVSPDGRWLAYTSLSTGNSEVWVRPVGGSGPAIRVSPNRGLEPVWSRDGSELFYLAVDTMMAVSVDTSDGFDFTEPVALFDGVTLRDNQPPSYDVTPEGDFILIRPQAGRPISVVLNWTELLRP